MAISVPQPFAAILYRLVVTARGEGSVFRDLVALGAQQWEPPADVTARQAHLLANQLTYCAAHVPYYRELSKSWPAISSDSALSIHDSLPLITKAVVRDHASLLRAAPLPRRITSKTTGGSTGRTVTVLKDRTATAHEMAASWLAYGWFGIRPGDRAIRWWGRGLTLKRRLRAMAASAATNRRTFSAFSFDDHDLNRYWHECVEFSPAFFYGYVSMLEAFARFVNRNGFDGTALGLKAIVTTSEVLTEPTRRLLVSTFNAPVQNEYGCGEVGAIAYECPSGSLHLMSGNLLVQVVRDDGIEAQIGESGEVVVTDLHNRAQPLVRYALGDHAEVGIPCVCGRGWPTLARVWGRSYDFITNRAGQRFHGELFMYVFEDLHSRGLGVEQFQVIQRPSLDLHLKVIQRTPLSEEQAEAIRRHVARLLPDTSLTIERVDSIPRAASGKAQIIINEAVVPRP